MASELSKDSNKKFSKTSTNSKKNGKEEDEQLYLLEVIIDDIDVVKEGLLETFQETPLLIENEKDDENQTTGPLRVLINFFDFPTIEIQEKDFKKVQERAAEKERKEKEERGEYEEPQLSDTDPPMSSKYPGPFGPLMTGKSCLFPMGPKVMGEIIKNYPLVMQVHRDDSDIDPAHLIGTIKFNLGQEFIDAVATASTPSVEPITVHIEGEYDMTNVLGEVTGSLSVLIRLSCFGATILTQFKYIQGQQGFKFSTSEGVMSSKAIHERKKKEESKKNLSKREENERPPFLTHDVDIAMFTSPTMINEFKVPVAWRKLTDEPVRPQTCGPKKLFKDIHKPRREENLDLAQLFPSVIRTVREQPAFYPGQPIITGNMFEDCSCRSQAIPPTSRQVLVGKSPPQSQSLSGKVGSKGGVLDIPPGTIFPCQFGQDWVVEAKPCDCRIPNSDKKKEKILNKVDLLPCPHYSNSGIDKNLDRTLSQWFGQVPKCGCSQSHISRVNYPCLEQAAPLLRTAPPPNTSESQTGECCAMPCFFDAKIAHQNITHQLLYNQLNPCSSKPTSSKSRANTSYNDVTDVKQVLCPSYQPPATVVCGLEGLLDPKQQNLKNLINARLMDPVCPSDSSRAHQSLCSCPKVPKFTPQPSFGDDFNCECTNLLTSMKSMDLPYRCPKKLDSQATSAPTTSLVAPSLPMPNKQPDSNLECPLANILKQAEHQGCQGPVMPEKRGIDGPSFNPTTANAGIKGIDKGEVGKNASEPAPKSGETYDQSKETEKDEEKARKLLHDEAAAHSAKTSFVDESTLATLQDDTKASKTGSSITYSTGRQMKLKKKHRKVLANKEPPVHLSTHTSIYPGSVIGHKDCVPVIRWVPKKMGWLWNIKDADGYMKPGRGWRPGSIPTNVIKIMNNVKTIKNKKEKKTTRPHRKTEGYKHMAAGGGDGPLFRPVDDTPTVHIHKKHGQLYLSLCPPSKEITMKKHPQNQTIKGSKSTGETVEEDSDGDSNRPAQFRIDLKNPEGLFLDPDLYETEETSSNSEDSYQMEIVAPSTLRNRQPQPFKVDFEMQVTEDNFFQPMHTPKQAFQEPPHEMRKRVVKKMSAGSKKSVGKRSAKAKY